MILFLLGLAVGVAATSAVWLLIVNLSIKWSPPCAKCGVSFRQVGDRTMCPVCEAELTEAAR